MNPYKLIFLLALGIAVSTFSQAQLTIQRTGIRTSNRMNRYTPIIESLTGQRITLEDYDKLIQSDPYKYHLVADYDEYGRPKAYTMRPSTDEEYNTRQFRDRDPAKQPKIGQSLAPFVMTATDEKTYRSTDLMGKVILLSFWISLDKPFWTEKEAENVTQILQPFLSNTDFVTLGVLNSEPPARATGFPFSPIPNGYGFHHKYHITAIPTFVVIDKTGRVIANLQGAASYEKLQQVLAAAMQ